jgi:hypothetical protein
MTGLGWSLVNAVSRLLEPNEREAVQGDLVEAGESAWQALCDVLGLLIRRQAAIWKSHRPWLAAFGLALPCSLFLMGLSVTVSRNCQQILDPSVLKAAGLTAGPELSLLVCKILLLIGWSWAGGFVVGSVSRRTVWVSAALCVLPCMFCLSRFNMESLSRFCLLLFLPPAIWGAHRGLRRIQIKLSSAIVLALTLTALTIPTWSSEGPWIPNWALSWPAWYLVATARRHGREMELRSEGNGE